ncbi:type IV secretory system conjugative DNA transfer family protein [uncultured Streptomyces sp.]|uniref:type IV secretory system conjugative DNA transfer family protein n=1 Tax=uncultured Streptomyces sp. TaxID=174707 RepID=UPI002636CA2A|nr:type IV secretory system conjugative DNA transfer family protein [uncultured Streptomyces sp.]
MAPRESGAEPDRSTGRGGVPDGLLVGLLVLLLGLAILTWTATGLSGLLSRGGWPDGLTLLRAPLALRELVTAPQDLAAAWPDTPPAQLSGYGFFWGIFISELMVLLVATVFVLGVVTRWRLVRRRAREDQLAGPVRFTAPPVERAPAPEQRPDGVHGHAVPPAPASRPQPVPPGSAPDRGEVHGQTAEPLPAPAPPQLSSPAVLPPSAAPAEAAPAFVPAPRGHGTPYVLYAAAADRRSTAVQAVLDAVGPVLVTTSDPSIWSETKDARSKLGPVLVYDPGHLCDTPARLHWSPVDGCAEPQTAADRAAALLAPVRPQSRLDAETADTAQTLLQCWLHAAALDSRPFRQVHRWAQGGTAHEPVRLLRTHPGAAPGLAGLLESSLTAHPERRQMALELVVGAFAALATVHIREACTPIRSDALALDSFAFEGGTLYVVGEPIEDPRRRPGAMPLLTALASHVVEHGRRMAARSTDGRLDPPMTLVLDDVAAVAPIPSLPELLAHGEGHGLATLALLRSAEQARARWPEPLPEPAQASFPDRAPGS